MASPQEQHREEAQDATKLAPQIAPRDTMVSAPETMDVIQYYTYYLDVLKGPKQK